MTELAYYAYNSHNLFIVDAKEVVSGLTAREGLIIGAYSGLKRGRYKLTASSYHGPVGTNPGWHAVPGAWKLEAIASNNKHTLFCSEEGEYYLFSNKEGSSVGRWFYAEMEEGAASAPKEVVIKTSASERCLPAEQAFEVMNDLIQHGLLAHVDFIVFFPEAREEALAMLRRHFKHLERRIRQLRGYGREDCIPSYASLKKRLRKLRNSF